MNTAKQVLFIDANILDAQSIINSISPDIDVYQLDNQTSAIQQIAKILEGYQNLDAIHIISHGSEGKLAFANGVLSNANTSDYSAQLKRIGSALSATGDLLLYGCDVAKGDDGLAFINTLADITGADVAASNDLTGQFGDWALESTTGNIEANSIVSEIYKYDLLTTVTRTIGGGTIAVTPKESYYTNEAQNIDAFAAIKSDGSVVTWAPVNYYNGRGEDSSAVANQLNGDVDVVQIFSTDEAFAALRVDGSVVTWGDSSEGGNSSKVAEKINGTIDVSKIYSDSYAFAALRIDGSVVVWGGEWNYDFNAVTPIDTSNVNSQLDGKVDILEITVGNNSFAALRADGSVVTWGNKKWGGDSSAVTSNINGSIPVVKIFTNGYSFAALRADGSVVTWGEAASGGNSGVVANKLDGRVDVLSITGSGGAYAAIRADGSVVTWGDSYNGGDSSKVDAQLNGSIKVLSIYSNWAGFTAIRSDGSAVSWGQYDYMSPETAKKLNGDIDVVKIYSNEQSWAALRADGSVVSWGG